MFYFEILFLFNYVNAYIFHIQLNFYPKVINIPSIAVNAEVRGDDGRR